MVLLLRVAKKNPSYENWVDLAPSFPDNFKPPFLIKTIIEKNTLTDLEKANMETAEFLMEQFSKALYDIKAPAPVKNKCPEEFVTNGDLLFKKIFKRVTGFEAPENI